MPISDSATTSLRIKPLAACLAAAFAFAGPALARTDVVATRANSFLDALRSRAAATLAEGARESSLVPPAPPVHGATLPVTNCLDDDSAGSLRAVVSGAADGDTVDLSALTCSTITLQSGVIFVAADNLTLVGPGTSLMIDGRHASALFVHTGAGTLAIDNLGMQNGFKYQNGNDDALGGCIFSTANVALSDTALFLCTAERGGAQDGYYAKGGAIYAAGNVSLIDSTVTFATAEAGDLLYDARGNAIGGAIYAAGKLSLLNSTVSYNYASAWSKDGFGSFGGAVALGGFTAKYSTISDNRAYGQTSGNSLCGGVGAMGEVLLQASTISRNTAYSVGGLYLMDAGSATITNSTISGNYAYFSFGGVLANQPALIQNSTIAFNEAPGHDGGGGIVLLNGRALDLESTIIADNASGGYAADLDSTTAVDVTGANNLVRLSGSNATLPAGTIDADPLLGPLHNNGGPTETHALLPGSPAIDAGNNIAGSTDDQRGTGFAREIGAAADIGAIETNADRIFASGFE